MTKKNILIATNLNVWSMGGKVGAPSFYKTLELYNKKNFNVALYTTEKNLEIKRLSNVKITQLPTLPTTNIPVIRTLHKLINYFLYQIIFIFLFFKGKKEVDLFYGYEIGFIPALAFLSKTKNIPFIARFQGTILLPKMKEFAWKILYFPHYFAIKQNADLTIMTDDGTQGDLVIKRIRKKVNNILFLKNGITLKKYNDENISTRVKILGEKNSSYIYNFISVSRLKRWKRVDRSLEIFELFYKHYPKSNYIIVGSGETRGTLEKKVRDIGLGQVVTFTGAINSDEVNYLLSKSNIFLSHYELSNVGNPLWEAIVNDCLVVTLSNGDTGKIIIDNFNGIISSENRYLDNANKLIALSKDADKIKELIDNAQKTLRENVQTWSARMEKEYQEVQKLLEPTKRR